MRLGQALGGILLAALLAAGIGCGGPGRSVGGRAAPGREVVLSVGNEDPETPVARIKVQIDGEPRIYGTFRAVDEGDYLFASYRVGADKVRVRATSAADGELLEAEKNVVVEDHLWIVVTRVRNLDGEPEIKIEISYESNDRWSKE